MALRWLGKITCDGGGSVMVVDLPGFAQWTGGVPFTELRAADPEHAREHADRAKTLHYWGQFTDRLPPPFAADGGHRYIACATEADALAKLADLRAAVEATFPRVEVHEAEARTVFVLPDTGELMTAELAPQSEYDAAWQANDEAPSFEHGFGENARGFFWDVEGSGFVDVGVSEDGTEIVLVRSWMSEELEDDPAELEAVRAFVASRRGDEVMGGSVELRSGKAVCVWAPIAPFQLRGMEAGPEVLMALGEAPGPEALVLPIVGDVGRVVRVRPGRYEATIADTDAEDDAELDLAERPWSCRWCRLSLRPVH